MNAEHYIPAQIPNGSNNISALLKVLLVLHFFPVEKNLRVNRAYMLKAILFFLFPQKHQLESLGRNVMWVQL